VSLALAPHVPVFPENGGENARRQIAECAAEMTGDDDAIAVDAGAIAYQLVQALPVSFRGTVITHSMPVMQLVTQRPAPPRLIALGGELLPARQAFVGPVALAAITQVRPRTFFLSAAAADARGLYARSGSEASVERLLMDVADQVMLLAPYEVFVGSAPALVHPLSRLTAVVTDRPPPHPVATALRRAGVAIRLAGDANQASPPRGELIDPRDDDSH
jgi:DeoR/GlpR family transcriptional regulator of sugar metabolism